MFPALVSAPKRIVLIHRSGLRQILGPFDPAKMTLHAYAEFKDASGRAIPAGLIRVHHRTAIYREIVLPSVATGRLGEFHPSQR